MLSYFFAHSITRKLIIAILIISSIVTTITTCIELAIDYSEDLQSLKSNIDTVEKSYAESITTSVWEIHASQLQSQLDGIITIAGIEYVAVTNDNQTLGQAGIKPDGDYVSKTFDLRYNTRGDKVLIGQVKVYAGTAQIWERLYKKILMIFVIQFIKTFLVSILFYFAIQLLMTRHLIEISKYLENFDLKVTYPNLHLKRTLKSAHPDELDVMTGAINQMRTHISQSYTTLNQMNQELEQKVLDKTKLILDQRQKLEFSSKMTSLGEMAGGIAHEINTPLAALSLSVDILLIELSKPELNRPLYEKQLLKNQKIISRIAKTIKGLRSISRDGSQDDFEMTSLKTIIDDTVTLCQERLNYNRIELRLPLIAQEVQVSCRPVEISQVLLNLLNNSHDAVLDCQEKWIEITLKIESNKILLSVTDSGPGLPEQIRQKIFEPFFTTKELGKGTGLGLSISKGIMENHNGHLRIDTKSVHTCFIMELPIALS